MSQKQLITIDGTSGVGKGTASRTVAQTLGWRWLDSGALYRLVAYGSEVQGITMDDMPALVAIANAMEVAFLPEVESDDPTILLNGESVNQMIRTEDCGVRASKISAYPELRQALMQRQHGFFSEQGLVADGRDMGTVVFPGAPLKVFLMAQASVRAERRHKQLLSKGVDVNIADLLQEIEARDKRDETRTVSPLKPAEGALIIDTSHLNAKQVSDEILSAWASLVAMT